MTSWTFLFIYLFIYFLYFLYYYFWLLFLWLGYEIFAGSLALVSVVLRSILMPLLGFQAQRCLFWIVHFFYASFSVPVPFLSLSLESALVSCDISCNELHGHVHNDEYGGCTRIICCLWVFGILLQLWN